MERAPVNAGQVGRYRALLVLRHKQLHAGLHNREKRKEWERHLQRTKRESV
jgi:hypothetical protein